MGALPRPGASGGERSHWWCGRAKGGQCDGVNRRWTRGCRNVGHCRVVRRCRIARALPGHRAVVMSGRRDVVRSRGVETPGRWGSNAEGREAGGRTPGPDIGRRPVATQSPPSCRRATARLPPRRRLATAQLPLAAAWPLSRCLAAGPPRSRRAAAQLRSRRAIAQSLPAYPRPPSRRAAAQLPPGHLPAPGRRRNGCRRGARGAAGSFARHRDRLIVGRGSPCPRCPGWGFRRPVPLPRPRP